MPKFPVDAPRKRVVKTLKALGFVIVREGNHIAMVREEPNGTRTPLSMPAHRKIKASTLRTILRHAKIDRQEFLRAYDRA